MSGAAPDGERTAVAERRERILAERLPLRILVAEDLPTNQKVMRLLLQRLGYNADLAMNGREALAALGRQAYDVVLMDMQMPEMDGISAALEIQHRFRPAERPRIIAVTANASDHDRQSCLAAGMAGFLSKPIRLESLEAALLRCPATPSPHASEDTTASWRMPVYMTQIQAEPAVLRDVLSTFVATLDDRVAALRAGYASLDLSALASAAHGIKGGCRQLGAEPLAQLAAELEVELRNGQGLSAAGMLVARMEVEAQSVRSAIEQTLDRTDLSG